MAKRSREQQPQDGRRAGGGGRAEQTNTTISPLGNATIHTSGQRGWVGVAGGVGGEREDEEDKGNGREGNTKEQDAARSVVSFSLEKEVGEPWPLSLL